MPAKGSKDMSKYEPKKPQERKENKTIRSQLNASAAYDANVDNIRLRLPKGYKEKMQEYVQNHPDKYNSVNAMIRILIENEIGLNNSQE